MTNTTGNTGGTDTELSHDATQSRAMRPWLDYSSGAIILPAHSTTCAIYNRALSASEVQQLYGLGAGTHVNTSSANLQRGSSLANGLVGYWTFDGSDISGSTVYDLSGNGNNGTNNGATPTIGKLGQALKFDGSSSYVNIPDLLHSSVRPIAL